MYITFTDLSDEYLNNLLVNVNSFAEVACMGARAFGVHTNCDPCDLDINLCLKKHLVRNLISAHEITERRLGYSLTPRYHEQTLLWDSSWPTSRNAPFRVQLNHPGVSALNVALTYEDVEGLESVSVQYIIQTNVELTPDAGNTYCIAELDSSLIDNPSKIILMDGTGKVFPQTVKAGFPRINEEGNWEIAIDRSNPASCPDTPNAYHCSLAYVDITPVECDGDLVPVYPGSQQRIPLAKPVETLDNDDLRYWFHVWELVKPGFQDEIVDISAGQYYKLFQTISFLCVSESETLPVVTCNQDCNCGSLEDSEIVPDLRIIDPQNGIIEICFSTPPCGCSCKSPKTITVSYKTDPSLLPFRNPLTELQEAISYWAAANLPLEICECKITKGFISEAQKAYTETRSNPLSQELITNFEYGDLHGQMVFSERLGNSPKYQRLLLI